MAHLSAGGAGEPQPGAGPAVEAPGELAEHDAAADLRPLLFPVALLNPSPDNARVHDLEKDVVVIADSLRRFGQRKPIVAKRLYRGIQNAVIAGNGTLLAARSLRWTHVAVTWFVGSDEDAQAYALVDNRSAELSRWDLQTLADQLRALRDRDEDLPGALGWDEASLGPLLAAEWVAPAEEPLEEHDHVPGGGLDPTVTLTATRDQYEIIRQAMDRLREGEGDPAIPEGRCLELISANFLAGA